MRILDCKEEGCKAIVKDAPVILDYVCDDCRAHFDELQRILTDEGVPFKVNKSIVRGLDYYTKTVFEFVTTSLGAQGTVCGGGRYDNLVESIGGKHTPCVGFGMGIERLIMLLDAYEKEFPKEDLIFTLLISRRQTEIYAENSFFSKTQRIFGRSRFYGPQRKGSA